MKSTQHTFFSKRHVLSWQRTNWYVSYPGIRFHFGNYWSDHLIVQCSWNMQITLLQSYATSMSSTNQHSFKWYPRLLTGCQLTFCEHCIYCVQLPKAGHTRRMGNGDEWGSKFTHSSMNGWMGMNGGWIISPSYPFILHSSPFICPRMNG